MYVSIKACYDCEKITNNSLPFYLLESINKKHEKVKTSDHHLNRELILLPYIYTYAQVTGKLVGSIMNSPVPKKLKGRSSVQKFRGVLG